MRSGAWIRANVAAVLLLGTAGPSGFGQPWAKEMFDHTSHDFGTVARGAKVEHTFTVVNKYEEDMHIAEVRTSCGCTTPEISKRTLKTWEKADVVAKVDTRGFYGRKDATLTVVFGGQFPAEVQLHVHVYIRSDIVVQPGSVQFGSVDQGTGAERKVTVSYAGRSDWQIRKVETNSPHLQAQAVKLAAAPAGQVAYRLVVQLDQSAPAGYIRDFLILVTNDRRPQHSRVPLAVEGVVVPALSVRPSPLLLGVLKPGQSVTRKLIVQGKAKFRILSAASGDKRLNCSLPKTEKPLHVLPVTFKADQQTGKTSGKIRIRTSLTPDKVLEVPFHVQVISPEPAKS